MSLAEKSNGSISVIPRKKLVPVRKNVRQAV